MALRNVAKTFSLEQQRVEINQIAADVDALNLSSTTLSSFSVTTNIAGISALSYDNTTGIFSYTPPDLSGYLTTSSAAAGITSQNIVNWDAAYGWGDHSAAGYLVNGTLASTVYRAGAEFKLIAGGSSTVRPYIHLKNSTTADLEIVGAQSESGGVTIDSRGTGTVKLKDGGTLRLETSNTGVTINGVLSATGGDSDDWNTAYGWGDHALAGYLTSADSTNWDIAYGWGDHASAGYLTSVALNDVSDVNLTTPSNGDLLSYDGSNWVNTPPSTAASISDTPPSSPNPGDLWWESDTGRLKVYYQDVDTSQWVDASPPLANPFNVTAADAANWNEAYGWGDHSTAGYLTSYTEADTLDTVTGRGAQTNNAITLGDVSNGGDLNISTGNNNYFKIFASGNEAYIRNTDNNGGSGGGGLNIAARTTLALNSGGTGGQYITFISDSNGAANLYYQTLKKLETTSTGVTITGDLSIPSKLIHDGDIDTYLSFDTDTIKLTTAGSERITVGSSGQLGLGGSNYGAAGEVLTSNGPTAAPSWQAPTVSSSGSSLTLQAQFKARPGGHYPIPIDADASGNSTYTRQSNFGWYGGALADNGCIYCPPYGENHFLKIDTKTKTATTIGPYGSVNQGYFGGMVAHPNGKLYGIPQGSMSVLEFDPSDDTYTTFGTDIFTDSYKYNNGVVVGDYIYCIPDDNGVNQVLKIDVVNKTLSHFGNTGFIGIGQNGVDDYGSSKFTNGVLAHDGKIYCPPKFARDPSTESAGESVSTTEWIIGIIDPATDTLDTTSFRFTEADLPGISKDRYDNTGNNISYAFSHAVLGPDGKIYCFPYAYPWICVIDVEEQTISRWSTTPLGTVTGTYPNQKYGNNDSGLWEFDGECMSTMVGANGKLYAVPNAWSNPTSPAYGKMVIMDLDAGTWKYHTIHSTTFGGTTYDKPWFFYQAVMGPEGEIYGIPYINIPTSGYYELPAVFNLPGCASKPADWLLISNYNGTL